MAAHFLYKRREFITLLGGAAAWPLAARAQSERVRRIGVLMGYPENDLEGPAFFAAFREGLRNSGGWRTATSGSTRAGRRPTTRRRGSGSRRNSSRYNPISFFRLK
jgi:hypothetical protein